MVQQPKRIQFDNLIKSLRTAMSKFPDKRTGKNIHYEIIDAAVGAFSIFFTQSPSFLSHQRLLKSRFGMSNAHSLFKMDTMPTDTHIRDILDEVSPLNISIRYLTIVTMPYKLLVILISIVMQALTILSSLPLMAPGTSRRRRYIAQPAQPKKRMER